MIIRLVWTITRNAGKQAFRCLWESTRQVLSTINSHRWGLRQYDHGPGAVQETNQVCLIFGGAILPIQISRQWIGDRGNSGIVAATVVGGIKWPFLFTLNMAFSKNGIDDTLKKNICPFLFHVFESLNCDVFISENVQFPTINALGYWCHLKVRCNLS